MDKDIDNGNAPSGEPSPNPSAGDAAASSPETGSTSSASSAGTEAQQNTTTDANASSAASGDPAAISKNPTSATSEAAQSSGVASPIGVGNVSGSEPFAHALSANTDELRTIADHIEAKHKEAGTFTQEMEQDLAGLKKIFEHIEAALKKYL